jgi:ribonuclease HI
VGWVKLNTDGCCKELNQIGCGEVLRGSDGEWLGGFAKFIGRRCAIEAEIWGVLEGLQHARRLNFRKVELNVDSLLVMKTINSDKSGSSTVPEDHWWNTSVLF